MSPAWPRILIATTNAGKRKEILAALSDVNAQLIDLTAFSTIAEPEETGETFVENARQKALYYAERSGLPTIAEDSGLVIDGLDGEPGVRSARFLGSDASYAQRFAEIERRLSAQPDASRTARFICAAAVVADGAVLFETTGVVEGRITSTPAGTHGFGYDPIFHYPGYNATLAEVTAEQKSRVSHRGRAFRDVARWLEHHIQPVKGSDSR